MRRALRSAGTEGGGTRILRVQTADHLANSGVGTGTMAMRTTSSMQPWLPTTIVSTEPAAVVGMGAPAQTQSGCYLPASLRLRVLSSQKPLQSLQLPQCVRRHVCAHMHAWCGWVCMCIRASAHMLCVTVCLCVRARVCAYVCWAAASACACCAVLCYACRCLCLCARAWIADIRGRVQVCARSRMAARIM